MDRLRWDWNPFQALFFFGSIGNPYFLKNKYCGYSLVSVSFRR